MSTPTGKIRSGLKEKGRESNDICNAEKPETQEESKRGHRKKKKGNSLSRQIERVFSRFTYSFWGKLGGDKDRFSKQGGPRVIGMKRKPSDDNT